MTKVGNQEITESKLMTGAGIEIIEKIIQL